ncbi:MAG: pyroglutamyl-peptidase I [Microbacteriaceae bacterium]
MTRVLLTGFEPFGGEIVNPSWQAVEAVAREWRGSETVIAVQLPVVFDESIDRAIAEHLPDLVVSVGQAGGRATIDLERVAINVQDARIPDNAGAQPIDEPVVAGAPAAHFTSLPIKAAVATLTEHGIPASVSQTAGTYVCNHVFYRLRELGVRGGFVHVPYSVEQVGEREVASVPLSTITEAVRLIVRTALDVQTDVKVGGGALD